MKIAEHLYIYLWDDPRENNCNSIFIDGKTPVLIDPGLAHTVNSLFDRMRHDNVDPDWSFRRGYKQNGLFSVIPVA
jgi:hypothetical protein